MFNYKLEPIPLILNRLPVDWKEQELAPAIKAFSENMMRLGALAAFPPRLSAEAMWWEPRKMAALFQVSGQPKPIDEQDPRHQNYVIVLDDILQTDIRKRVERSATKVMSDDVEAVGLGLGHVQFTSGLDPVFARGVSAWLDTLVINAWTAFETVSGDLWEVCLNSRPNPLAALSGQKNRIGKLAKRSSDRLIVNSAAQSEKTVDLSFLARYNYDVSNKMGYVLRDRFSFAKLAGIREAFSVAFSSNHEKIDKALAHNSLDALSEVRNLLVHRGGLADKEYVKKTTNLPNCPKIVEGERIALDGEVVVNLTLPALTATAHLINAVDKWIAETKTK